MKQEELPFPAPKEPEPPKDQTWGQLQVQRVVDHLKSNPIVDYVRQGVHLDAVYDMHNGQSGLQVLRISNGKNLTWCVHSHAFGQICSKLRFAPSYARGLLEERDEWAYQLVTDNLNRLFDMRVGDRKLLLRTVNGQIRGFLSNAYGRFDTVKLIDTFSRSCKEVGAEPFNGFWSDLRVAVQGALENHYEVSGTPLKAGVMLKHSDFGLGAMEVKFFISIGGHPMVGRSGMRKIHKGKRLKEDSEHNDTLMSKDSAELSKQMYALVHQHLSPENISAVMAEVELAGSTAINVDQLSGILMALELSDGEAKRVSDYFEGVDQNLPQGSTVLRLASTIAWVAGEEPDVERRLELMETAGELIMPGKK